MKNLLSAIAFALIAMFFIAGYLFNYGNEQTHIVTIESKERVAKSSGSGESLRVSSYYLVFTNNGVFSIKDQLLLMKFDSSDIYGQLRPGETYTIKTNGYRVPFLSSYPNIFHVSQAGESKYNWSRDENHVKGTPKEY